MPSHLHLTLSHLNSALKQALHSVDIHRINLYLTRQEAEDALATCTGALGLRDYYLDLSEGAAALALESQLALIRTHWEQEVDYCECDLRWALRRVERLRREREVLEERWRGQGGEERGYGGGRR